MRKQSRPQLSSLLYPFACLLAPFCKSKIPCYNLPKRLCQRAHNIAKPPCKRAGIIGAVFIVVDASDVLAADLNNSYGSFNNTKRLVGSTVPDILGSTPAGAATGSVVSGLETPGGFAVDLVGGLIGSYISEGIADRFW